MVPTPFRSTRKIARVMVIMILTASVVFLCLKKNTNDINLLDVDEVTEISVELFGSETEGLKPISRFVIPAKHNPFILAFLEPAQRQRGEFIFKESTITPRLGQMWISTHEGGGDFSCIS